MRSLNPLDIETITKSVKKTGKVLVVEEDWKTGGIGGEITTLIIENCFDYLDAPVKRVAGKDVPMPYAINLEKMAIPQLEDIKIAIKEML